MKIKINSLPNGLHEFVLSKNVSELNLKEPFNGDVKLSVGVEKSPGQIIFNCSFELFAKFRCDRCLKLYDEKLTGKFKIFYIQNGTPEEFEEDDIYKLTPELIYVDLTKDFYDYINLAVPMKHLCSEDCKGICPKCGANLNYEKCTCENDEINPIWEPLLKLKNINDK